MRRDSVEGVRVASNGRYNTLLPWHGVKMPRRFQLMQAEERGTLAVVGSRGLSLRAVAEMP